MASNSNVAGDLEDDPDKISELRRKAAQKKEEQKKKIQEKLDEEHKIATERMQNINMLKKKEEEYNEMKNNAKNINMGKFQNSLVLSESATAHSAPKRKQPQQIPNQMTKELQNLANINKMISDKKNNERKVMAKKIEITPDSESDSESESESDSAKEKKSVVSSSSRSFIVKKPNLQKMIGNSSDQSNDETSSVKQIGVVNRETAEKMMNNDEYPEISCSKSKDSGNKSKGRPKKISTK
jgi:hypothetical protein